ncbi:MAG: energy transducer TonB [Alistipes sp.]|nr:energy transducer TonB [Alistipes sp.]MBQ3249093.1 energy transducer TonB [Alistipes sp.]MBR3827393.1 energy transducer TonB [Alistipes sp.]
MEIKKSPKADLQNKRMLFLLFGLVVALGITGLAFSMNSKPEAGEYKPPKRETTEMEQIDNTRQDQPETPPEQQKAQAQVVTDVLNIVSNDQKIETNIVFADDADEFDDFEMIIEEKEEEIVEEEIFITVEEMPKFRGGGLPEFRTWVQQNVKYPQIALENGIQGNVVIQFVVGADGKMTNFKVLQSPDKTLSDATIEVLKKANEMKNGWKPGKQRGKPVKVSFTLPVAFKIQN